MPAIPPALEPQILKKAAEGSTTREVSQWLLDAHGVTASYKAVQRLLSRRRAERAEVAKAVVRDELTKTVLTDIEVLALEQERATKLSERLHKRAHASLDALERPGDDVDALRIALAGGEKFAELAIKASASVKAIVDTKLHYSGADAPEDSISELADAESRLTRKLARLAAGQATAAAGDPDAAGESGS